MRPKLLMENDYILRQCVGIDVSKETLVVTMCMFSFAEEAHNSDVKTFKNNKTGFNQLVKWSLTPINRYGMSWRPQACIMKNWPTIS